MAFGVSQGHLVEVAGKQGRLFPTLAAADLDDHVLLVERIARHELGAESRGELPSPCGELRDLLAGEVAEVRVVAFDELLRPGEPSLRLAQRPDRLDDRSERRQLLTDLADAVAVGGCLGIRYLALELLVAPLNSFEPAAQSRCEYVAHAAASASRSPAIASSSDATATSIIRASGRRVVTRCRTSPGATSRRMTGDRSCAAPSRSASYEMEATGITSRSRTTRSTMRFTRGRNAKIAIAMTTTRSRNAVPQRGWAVGYGSMRAGTSGSPCSNAWIVICSAP